MKVERDAAEPKEPLVFRSLVEASLRHCRRDEEASGLVVPVNFKKGPANPRRPFGGAEEKRPCADDTSVSLKGNPTGLDSVANQSPRTARFGGFCFFAIFLENQPRRDRTVSCVCKGFCG